MVVPVSLLVADDDPGICTLLATICKRLGYACDRAEDGEQTLAKLRERQYDVLLLDLMMPKVSGYEVIDALDSLPRKPAVIVITAQGEKQTSRLREANVVRAVVTKPFDLASLIALIKATAR